MLFARDTYLQLNFLSVFMLIVQMNFGCFFDARPATNCTAILLILVKKLYLV